MKGTLLIICFALTLAAISQEKINGKISVTIQDEQLSPLEGATVELLKNQDTSLIKTALTDKSGLAEFEGIAAGDYFLRVSMVNHSTLNTEVFSINDAKKVIVLPAISLSQQTANLKDVTVTTRKPFIQKLRDRIVVNVENSIVNVGSSAFDVLERSPGVTIDQNDAISLRGRQGVIIMIDGKVTPLSGAELATYLRGLPSNAIERIDLITNPS